MRRRFLSAEQGKKYKYLTAIALEDDFTASFTRNALTYSIDGGEWVSLPTGTSTPAINKGHTISFRGDAFTPNTTYGIGTFTFTKKANLVGNVMSLLSAEEPAESITANYAFRRLFRNNTNIIEVADDLLPAQTLSQYCYYEMFYGCSGLLNSPTLPALTLENYCYRQMFQSCTSLETAGEIKAATAATYCFYGMFQDCTNLVNVQSILYPTEVFSNSYNSMFLGCTSLSSAPELPATKLEVRSYNSMFEGCSSLTKAPTVLPATTSTNTYIYASMFKDCINLVTAPRIAITTLKNYCCSNMFNGCTNLVNVYPLEGTTLAGSCYYRMFMGCSSLKSVTMLATGPTNATNIASYCNSWLDGVYTSGTLTVSSTLYSYITTSSASGCPVGWTLMQYGDTPPEEV